MIPSFSGRNKKLEIECKNEKGIITKIVFDPLFLNYNITVGNVQYKSSGRKPFLRLKNKNGSTTTISFENALVRNHNVIVEFGSQTIVSEYSWFHNGLVVLPFSIRTGAKLYNNGSSSLLFSSPSSTAPSASSMRSSTWLASSAAPLRP